MQPVHYVKSVHIRSYTGPCFSEFIVRMRENTDQNNSEYGHFSRIGNLHRIIIYLACYYESLHWNRIVIILTILWSEIFNHRVWQYPFWQYPVVSYNRISCSHFNVISFNPSRPNPGRREKNLNFFWHFFVMPQKVLWKR